MCGLYAYNKSNDNSTDEIEFGGGILPPEDSKINLLVYLFVCINLIDSWLNVLGKTFA